VTPHISRHRTRTRTHHMHVNTRQRDTRMRCMHLNLTNEHRQFKHHVAIYLLSLVVSEAPIVNLRIRESSQYTTDKLYNPHDLIANVCLLVYTPLTKHINLAPIVFSAHCPSSIHLESPPHHTTPNGPDLLVFQSSHQCTLHAPSL
jgi:hypothetical protein